MNKKLKLAINGVWSSRVQLLIVGLVVGILWVGQGKELSLSLQGTLRYSSMLAMLSVGLFVLVLWYWTYISVLVAPVRSHRQTIWSDEAAAEMDPSLRASATAVATAYSAVILLFVLYQLWQIGDAAGAVYATFTNVILVISAVGARTNYMSRTLDSPAFLTNLPAYLKRYITASRFRRLDVNSISVALLSILISPLIYYAWTAIPNEHAFPFGSFGSLFLSLSILAPWLFLAFVLCQGLRLPIATTILLAPILAESIYGYVGFHSHVYAVRSLEQPAPARPSLDKSIQRWRTQNDLPNEARPVIFISAAGGGIRAAYWTAAVLGRLEDCVQEFHKSVFSISAVSGGSLGAAAYVSLLADRKKSDSAKARCRPRIPPDADSEPIGFHQSFLKLLLSQDYLAPVVRETILGDIPRSIVPWSASPDATTDRAAALEGAFEQAWLYACKNSCLGNISLSTPFSALTTSPELLPFLFLNGVHEETGKRIITSTSRTTTEHFLDSTDFFDLVQHDIRTSTAVLNSARFPIISPSGALLRRTPDPKSTEKPPRSVTTSVGHVIDGGYFDNNGTVTSHEIAVRAVKSLKIGSADQTCSRSARKSIFIEILNDTSLSELDSDRDNFDSDVSLSDRVQELAALPPSIAFHPLVVTFNGLESSRGARAVHSSKSLAKYARSLCGGQYFVMPLCKGIVPQPALGWMLSEDSRKAMDQLLVGGLDTKAYANSVQSRDFFDCYNLIQANLGEISELLRGAQPKP